jgi:hypothetical protein
MAAALLPKQKTAMTAAAPELDPEVSGNSLTVDGTSGIQLVLCEPTQRLAGRFAGHLSTSC